MIWTDEKTSQMLRLHDVGLSAREIAKAIGCNSRNEVIGKLWRIQKRVRPDGSSLGRPKADGSGAKQETSIWDRRTFAPYAVWKAERQKERELGLR